MTEKPEILRGHGALLPLPLAVLQQREVELEHGHARVDLQPGHARVEGLAHRDHLAAERFLLLELDVKGLNFKFTPVRRR